MNPVSSLCLFILLVILHWISIKLKIKENEHGENDMDLEVCLLVTYKFLW